MRVIKSGETPILRLASPELDQLIELATARYPNHEWGSFLKFGYREMPGGLVLTLAEVDAPIHGDLDESVGNVAMQEPYSLRTALLAETHPLAVGFFHSHPEGYRPLPSHIDDDMDSYYADYFSGFAPRRPYVSLVYSEVDGRKVLSGRVFWRGEWYAIRKIFAERALIDCWSPESPVETRPRLARLTSAFGLEADTRLRNATVGVVGAGGTGSAAIEVLARAGIGRMVIVDPDVIEESNRERVHGSLEGDTGLPKVAIAKRHVAAIDASIDVTAIVGSVPQASIVDALCAVDLILGCSDQQHSRLALNDLSLRYLIPVLDSGVILEGKDGNVSGQIVQVLRMLPNDPCLYCRGMVSAQRVTQELMSDAEREMRRRAAAEALRSGREGGAYWLDMPQLNTVGYLTTAAGSLLAGYAIGWLTRRFDPPFRRLQMNLVAPFFDVTDYDVEPRSECSCRRTRGRSDQANAEAMISAPTHWPEPAFV